MSDPELLAAMREVKARQWAKQEEISVAKQKLVRLLDEEKTVTKELSDLYEELQFTIKPKGV